MATDNIARGLASDITPTQISVSATPANGEVLAYNSSTETFEWIVNGSGTDAQNLKVSGNDSTPGFLEDKVIGTTDKIVVTVNNDGGNENIQINVGSDLSGVLASEYAELVGSTPTTLHYHNTDRDCDNHVSGTTNKVFTATEQSNLAILTSSTPTTLHTHDATNIENFDVEVGNNSAVTANTAKVTNATHSGEVTGSGVLTVADNVIDEANLLLDSTPTNGYILTADSTASGGLAWKQKDLQSFIVACSDETTALTATPTVATFRVPYAFTVTEVRASVTTAPVGSTIIVDINQNGTTLMATDKLSIDAGETTSTTAITSPALTTTALTDDSEITIDIDQIGSSTAGAGLKVAIIGQVT